MLTGSRATKGPLKVCVVSNYYPPAFIGGYELGCSDVVEGLKRRGQEVKVLTSTDQVPKTQNNGEVYRWLRIATWWSADSFRSSVDVLKKEISNQRAFRQFCREFNPHLIYIWNPVGISLSLASIAQQFGCPVCYFVSDHWLEEWENDLGYRIWREQPTRIHRRIVWKTALTLLRGLKVLHRPEGLNFHHTQFASQNLKQQAIDEGQPVSEAKVIHWGIDVVKFRYAEKPNGSKRLLYVGQLLPHKGVHTAIEALKVLVSSGHTSASLTIAGGSVMPAYEAEIRQMVSSLQLEEHVRFTGHISRELVASLYQEHDILVFPSIWDEPFSITVLEAMASGLAVVGTATGGSSEILRNGVNSLVFQKEDAQQCAACLATLFGDQQFFNEIRHNGRRTVERNHRIEQMVETIECSLKELAA